MYRSFADLVKFIPNNLILFDDIVYACEYGFFFFQVVHCNCIEIRVLSLYPTALLNSFITFNFFEDFLGFSI